MFSRSTNTVVPVVTIHSNFGATETSYVGGQEIHGQGEWADQIYEVVRGAVRSYKVLSDGRRQICAFHLPNDIFGWENGPAHRFTAEAIVDTTVRVVRRQILEYVATTDVQVTHNLLSMATKNLEHAENQMMLLGQRNSLVLLCHKFCRCLRDDRRMQHWHRCRVIAIATANKRWMVAIELGTWRCGRIGGAAGSVTSGKGKFFDCSGAMRC